MLDPVAGKLEQYLDLLGARQKLVTSNIANADTPGFKTKDLDFQTEFLNAAAGVAPHTTEVVGLRAKNDGNNVSIEQEMGNMNKNTLLYNATVQVLASRLATFRAAIAGR